MVGAGDIARCDSDADEATADLLDDIPGTVITVGDNAYPNGTDAEFAECYEPSWGRHKARTKPTAGNHEYHSPGAGPYFRYFGSAAGDSGKGYYSYDLGAWHVVVLNTHVEIDPASPQIQWLRDDLAASNAFCTLAYWHYPLFSSGTTTTPPEAKARQREAFRLLYRAGAEVVIAAHEHRYERFAPLAPDTTVDQSYGIRQFIVGTGGGALHRLDTPPHRHSEIRDDRTFGVLKLALDSAGFAWEFIPAAGGTFTDAGTGTCHGAPPNRAPTADPGGPYSTTSGTVTFDGRAASDPDGDSLRYQWDFGDGATTDAGPTPTHTYQGDGTYAVTLTVQDPEGASSGPVTAAVTVTLTPGAPITLSGAGAIATCGSDDDQATALLLDALPGYVFTVGDHALPASAPADYADCYQPTWGRHKTRTWAVLGNLDYERGQADGTFDYFGARAGPRGLGYHSFDLGAWHIIVLNDNETYVPFASGSVQDQWLVNDLATSTQPCLLALWHVPLFVSTNTAGYTSNPGWRTLWNRLYAAGADVVVNSNWYHYERMAPMTPDGLLDPVGGIRQFVAGTGGQSRSLPTVAVHPNSVVRAAAFGVLRFTLRQGSYDWAFVPVAGESFGDSGTGACH